MRLRAARQRRGAIFAICERYVGSPGWSQKILSNYYIILCF
jgi:hypothetical protein